MDDETFEELTGSLKPITSEQIDEMGAFSDMLNQPNLEGDDGQSTDGTSEIVESSSSQQQQQETSKEVDTTNLVIPPKPKGAWVSDEEWENHVRQMAEGKNFGERFWENWSNQKIGWGNPSGIPAAAGAGLVDWGTSLYNKVMPGFDIPQLPAYKSEGLQAVRDISSVIIPSIYLTKGLTSVGTAAHTKVGWSLGNDPFVRWLGTTGIAALSGVIADEVAPVQERDHNALGALKEAWPMTYGWVSDDWATLDDDEPDVKRAKNRNEGLALGLFSDVLVSAGRLAKALKGVDNATQWIPENEKATNFLAKLKEANLSDDGLENIMLQSAKRRYDQLGELGEVNLSKSVNLDEPVFGVHDVYTYGESGIRSADLTGVYGASIDAVKISKNIDSIYGRVGSVATEGAIKYMIDGSDAGHKLITDTADILKDSKYGYKSSNGRYISHAEVVEAGTDLGARLYGMTLPEMDSLLKKLSGVDVDTGARVLNSEAYAGVMQAIKRYTDDFINMDIVRAQGYIATSFGGQISDMAEGLRLAGDSAGTIQRAQEQILDRVQYLMQMKGTTSYARGRALNMLNLFNRIDPKSLTKKQLLDTIKNEKNSTLSALARIQMESKDTVDTLRALKAERPELLGPLMLAYEMTDGNIDTISKLNNYFKQSTGVFKKVLVDGSPELPSAWLQGVWSNIYNSVLSSFATPIKAGAANVALMIQRPIATFAGAMIQGDKELIQRASYMYFSAFGETLQNAFTHMNQVYRRAAQDPASVGYIMRDDIARKNADQMQLLRSFADAAEVRGDFGPSVMVNQIEAMNDLAEHPWLRFSANSMTGFDGFTRSFIASVEAKGRAYDDLMKLNPGKAIDSNDLQKLAKGHYDQMFDDTGMITDKAVEYASREIAMNLNTKGVDALSNLIRRYPIMKPFLMFPKTSMNMLQFAGSANPLGLFINDLNKFKLPFNDALAAKVDIEGLLASRGIPFDDNAMMAYETIRAELRGRKAIGTVTVSAAALLFMGDRITGNGINDKTRQRLRREAGWTPRSIKGLDGKWYSYENLGPISDWLALTADIFDHATLLDENNIETLISKSAFILSANLTNKSFMAGLEPLNDVLAGNPAAMSRWLSSFGSGLLPLSGQRNELGRLISPQLKEVRQNLNDLTANRNIFAKSGLPDQYDWIDGGRVGEPMNFFTRVWNTYSPWFRVRDAISPEKQFLIDIEFDGRPQLRTNGRGVEYTNDQRSEVTQIMGERGYFKREIQRIMNSVDGQEFRKRFKESGVNMDRTLFLNIHSQLKAALRRAKGYAEGNLSSRNKILKNQRVDAEIEHYTRTGQTEKIQQLLNMHK